MNVELPRRAFRRTRGAVAVAALALGAGCGGGASSISSHVGMSVGTVAPAFALQDVNQGSVRFTTDVAPIQYVGSASAWYFGHAT